MSFNLLDAAKGLITNELVSKASSFLGESEGGVSKAISGVLPSLVSGLADKASSHDGANAIAGLASEAHNSGILNNLGSFFNHGDASASNAGSGILSNLLGDNKTSSLTSLISNFSGIKSSSATSLLSMAAPMLLGLLGKHAATSNVNAGGLASLLSSQKSGVASAIPSGLNLSSVFSGIGNTASNAAHTVSSAASNTVNQLEEKASSGLKWLLPLLLLALAAMLAWYFLGKGCKGTTDAITAGADSLKSKTEQVAGTVTDATTTAVNAVAGKVDSLSGNFMYDMGKTVSIDLPNGGGKLEVGENSTENKLYKFLSDKNSVIDTVKGNWFEFTNVHFKTGGSEIDDASMVQLKNMVAITKAYPTAQFKLGGYTDNSGDSSKNVVLSQKRAEAVVATLHKLGAGAASIVGAKGFGPQWPIATNATAEGKAQNRRVAVNVKAK